jgi:mannose-1-phosphate guanylyltransferase/mannose-6-phosphate isomerase
MLLNFVQNYLTQNLKKDEYIYIPVNILHRIENIGNELMEFTETQIGGYLGEDDIIRYEDDFNRT